MSSNGPIWVSDLNEKTERETRIRQALLRRAVENLRSNRPVVPLFGLAICGMFPQWISAGHLAGWYCQMMAGMVPQLLVLARFPQTALTSEDTEKWTKRLAAANLFFVANWASFGLWFWASGNFNSNHIMIQLLLGASLAAHAASTGPCLGISRPALLFYMVVMTLVPLQGIYLPATFTHSLILALSAPIYVAFTLLIARRNRDRARAAILLAQERDSLLAELVMAKLESDRGRELAEAASLAKSHFLANMSHELRTPLNAILGFSEMITSRLFEKNPERTIEYAALINSSGKHLLTLINDILDLAKIEAGRWELRESEVNLHTLAQDALQLVSWRAKENNALLENAIDPRLERAFADERAIKQILVNLLSNAVKFTPEAGRITVFAHRITSGGMVFGVSDTGVGISAEDQRKVFDSFGQGKHDIAIADKGTGLGLAIVKGLAESHGGRVVLESLVGKGTTVTVQLPASRVVPEQREAPELNHFVA
ncbi:MAG TPA: HAMP domain-containing sensor histidine kinase [Rhizomicrobium sp.]|nr:HAMP domain-containing sensor histidine kinase [Rhizomicrobium sp.]